MHRVGHQLPLPGAGRRFRGRLRGWRVEPAIDDVVLVDDRGRLALPADLMADGDEDERAAGAFLAMHRLDRRAPDDSVADADFARKTQAAAGPHAARQFVHRRQEAAALRMAVRSDLGLAGVGQEEQPVGQRRHEVAGRKGRIATIERRCKSVSGPAVTCRGSPRSGRPRPE